MSSCKTVFKDLTYNEGRAITIVINESGVKKDRLFVISN